MISEKNRRKCSRILAGITSVAMTMTMAPELWLPVHAEIVRDEIQETEILNEVTTAPVEETEESIMLYSYDDAVVDVSSEELIKYTYGNSEYAIIDIGMSWTEAKSYCERLGGHLLTVNSSEEQEYVNKKLLSIGSQNMYWLGGYRENYSEPWKWVTGENIELFNWSSGEPNSKSENYIHMYRSNNTTGTWNNTTEYSSGNWFYGSINSGFICEWDNVSDNKPESENVQSSIGALSEYTVFSANQNEDLALNGWKANFTGGIYSGRNFVCNLSEFYLDGKADAVGTVSANGWKINIPEKNENIEAIAMPELEEAILAKAGEYTYYPESPSFIQDTRVCSH